MIGAGRRWAVVTRDAEGRATVESRHWTVRGAARRRGSRESRFVEPTDAAPQRARLMRVVAVLGDGPATAVDVAARTALSVRVVERDLGFLARAGWARYELLDGPGERGELGAWRLATPEEMVVRVVLDPGLS